eukprot:1153093-Pelagomonas_calceolata.AAC.1
MAMQRKGKGYKAVPTYVGSLAEAERSQKQGRSPPIREPFPPDGPFRRALESSSTCLRAAVLSRARARLASRVLLKCSCLSRAAAKA